MYPGCETSREGKQAVATPHDIAIPSGCVTCRCCTGTVCQRRSTQWSTLVRVTHLAWEWQAWRTVKVIDPERAALLLRCRRRRRNDDGDRQQCRAAETDEEVARPHSITSSARARSDCGTVRPSALAVFKLMTSSNLVGCSTGRSAGLAPLRIFPA